MEALLHPTSATTLPLPAELGVHNKLPSCLLNMEQLPLN
jgi:hypothetical protein